MSFIWLFLVLSPFIRALFLSIPKRNMGAYNIVFFCCKDYLGSVAGVAQLVEQLTCNQQVGGSIPFASSIY
jgi:xanthine/uracil permease